MNLDIDEGIKLTDMAIIKRQEMILHNEWVAFVPHMKESKSFEQYKQERLPPQIDYEAQIMSKDDIMSELIGKE
jgi:hypothetical protein